MLQNWANTAIFDFGYSGPHSRPEKSLEISRAASLAGVKNMPNNEATRHIFSTVAVLGAGVIGASWAEAFLSRGLKVRIWDPRPDLGEILDGLKKRHGIALTIAASAQEAVEGAEFVQENGPERLETKRALFALIAAAVAPKTVVASSTSTLQPSDLQLDCPFSDRLIVGHPFNPPSIIPLVEVVGGASTSEETLSFAMSFYRHIGKHPIRLHRERLGHLANRLQAALWREAIDAVACGQASVEDVDAVVTQALGPRWALMGPFATFHLGGGQGGLAHFLDHLGPAFDALWDDAHRPDMTEDLKRKIIAGVSQALGGQSIADLAARRDHKLRAVLSMAGHQDGA